MSAALPASRSSRGCSMPTTTATGWRWPSRRSTGGRPGIPGTRASSHGRVGALEAAHDALTPSPTACIEPAEAALRRRCSAAGPSWPPRARRQGSTRGRAAPVAPGRARGGVARGHRRADARPRRHPLRQHVLGRRRPRLRRLAARRRRLTRLRPGGLGALRRPRGRAAARRARRRCTGPRAASTPRSSRPARRPQRLLRARTRCGRPRPGCRRSDPSRRAQGEVALAWLRRRTGWWRPARRHVSRRISFARMRFGLQIPNFTRRASRRALRRRGGHGDRGGGGRLRLGLGDGPLLPVAADGRARRSRCSTRTRCSARWRRGRRAVRLGTHGDRRHVSQPGASGQDRHDARRHQWRPGDPRASARPGTTSSTKGWASTSRRPASGSTAWRRRCRSAGRCSATRRPASTGATTAPTRRATCRAPLQPGGPPILVGGGGEKRTLQPGGAVRGHGNFFGDVATVAHKVRGAAGALRGGGSRPVRGGGQPAGHAVLTANAQETAATPRTSCAR